jgi:hypothetical protein
VPDAAHPGAHSVFATVNAASPTRPPNPAAYEPYRRCYVLIVVGTRSQASAVIASIDGTSMMPIESQVNIA